jgi:predicted lipoprotein
MAAKSKVGMITFKKASRWVLAGLGLLLLCGSFDLQNLEKRRAQTKASQFDAADYARGFWDARLPEILDQSPEARSLVHLFNTNMDAAIQQGQTLGESRVHAYLLQGMGTVVAVDKKGIALKLAESDPGALVRILTGLFISGNAIRDASGLVDVSAFSDTMKFNRISSEINKIVVTEVIKPFLAESPEPGQRVRFIGAAELAEDATEETPFGRKDKDGKAHLLSIVPIRLAFD